MSRTIPALLQDHLNSGTTTLCGLIRIDPVRPGYGVVGLTTLDRDVVYDDDDGPVTYYAAVGYTASNYVGTADFSVDNAETQSLFPEFDIPQLTEADISAGAYDYAAYKMLLVNYEDLTQGHILYSTGTMGEMKVVDGLSFMGELRSLFQQFRQSIVERDSLTCRATFGSQAADSPNAATAPKVERFPCGIVVDPLWVAGIVTGVGVEDTRSFTDDGMIQPDNRFVPGICEWLTGANAGRTFEVESYTSNIVSLAFPAGYPIAEGDTFRIRPDCTKQWGGANSCLSYNNRLNFRGEPNIPVGDAGSTANPGSGANAGVTPGEQGETTSPYEPPQGTVADPLENGEFELGNVGWASVVTDIGGTVGSSGLPSGYSFGIVNDPGNGYLGSDWVARYTSIGGSAQWTLLGNSVIANNAPSGGAGFRCRVWTRLNSIASGGFARAGLVIEGFSDPALTNRIGLPVTATFGYRSTAPSDIGEWRLVETNVSGVAYIRLSIYANSAEGAEIDFDAASWGATQAAP